ncbi:Phosphoribosyl pyrophosphate synthase-associated protein 2 [Trichinella patagoniensis]|uniref:Phosphoribosyl pyrophosphate synthase-associated protein 2 n=1 Tax=Trichinella patagoniensis TaxID=990121 RepID=A0A0V1A892_9BILA|nr:Phosphoribosyl pyrophosphate synthase-associated protein 2 [Trichinella patagoniensis]
MTANDDDDDDDGGGVVVVDASASNNTAGLFNGKRFVFIDSSAKLSSFWILSENDIDEEESFLHSSLKSFYSSSKADKAETSVIMYNDWPPYARKSLTTYSTKGTTRPQNCVFMRKNGNSAMWMVHNIPSFPDHRKFYWPEYATKQAHIVFCLTLPYDTFSQWVSQIAYENPLIYFHNVPKTERTNVVNSLLYGKGVIAEPNYRFSNSLKTVGGERLFLFSKLAESNMDMYQLIGKMDNATFRFWEKSDEADQKLDNICSRYLTVKRIYGNIYLFLNNPEQIAHEDYKTGINCSELVNELEIQLCKKWKSHHLPLNSCPREDYLWKLMFYRFGTGPGIKNNDDASKWLIELNGKKIWCFGSLPRERKQILCSGGMICMQNEKIWNAFDASIKFTKAESFRMEEQEKRGFAVLVGSSHPELALLIINRLPARLFEMRVYHQSNRETMLEMKESVRGKEIFIIQTATHNVNDDIMELLIMIYACKTASARRITVVMPYLPYTKCQNREKRTPIVSKLLANMITKAGASRVITLDLCRPEVQGFYSIPVDNVRASWFLAERIRERISDYKNAIVIAKNPTVMPKASSLAEKLGLILGVIHGEMEPLEEEEQSLTNSIATSSSNSSGSSDSLSKQQLPHHQVPLTLIGDVGGRIAILVDYVIDYVESFIRSAEVLKRRGAYKIYVVATHAIFGHNAPLLLENSVIDTVFVTNSIPHELQKLQCHKIETIDVSPILSEAIRRCFNRESLSRLFSDVAVQD